MTTNRVDLIDSEDLIPKILEESALAYACDVIIIESFLLQVQTSGIAQISAAIAERVTLPEVYKDFEDDCSAENAGHLSLHEDHHHSIDFIDDKTTSL